MILNIRFMHICIYPFIVLIECISTKSFPLPLQQEPHIFELQHLPLLISKKNNSTLYIYTY